MSDRISGLLVVAGALFFLWAYNTGRWTAISNIITRGASAGTATPPGNTLAGIGSGLGLVGGLPGQTPGVPVVTAPIGTSQYWDQVAQLAGLYLSGGTAAVGQVSANLANEVQQLLQSHCDCNLQQYAQVYQQQGVSGLKSLLQFYLSPGSGWVHNACTRQCAQSFVNAVGG